MNAPYTHVQFSISLINKPGMMSTVIGRLAKAKCDIAAMTVVDTTDHGTIRLVFNSGDDEARKILQDCNGGPVAETEVIVLPMSNRPGAIADVATRLAEAKVNIQYAYVTAGAPGGKTLGVFRTSDNKKAIKVLQAAAPAKKRDDAGTVKRVTARASRR